MTSFIGGEYLIAFGLMKTIREGNDSISFQELRSLAHIIQKKLNESDIDAVIIDSNLMYDLYIFDKYFDFVELNHIPYVKCKPGIRLKDLYNRFAGFLPIDVLCIMAECMKGQINKMEKERD